MEICAVIVTYNRLDCLKVALDCYDKQTKKPKYIVVVDNHSTDSTADYLEQWKKNGSNRYVLSLPTNTGGSGGFYSGLEFAQKLDSDWIWLSDDDAYPENDVFEILNTKYEELRTTHSSISALCTRVSNCGNIDAGHRRRLELKWNSVKEVPVDKTEYEKEWFSLDLFSYVGCLISKEALSKAGLTEKDYFIYFDDTEHSYRIRKQGEIICVTNAVVNHNVVSRNDPNVLFDWKMYYAYRNQRLFFKKHFGLSKVLFDDLTFYSKCFYRKLRHRTPPEDKLRYIALKDARNNVKGLKAPFYPGWKLTLEDWQNNKW